MHLRTFKDIDVKGKTVLYRVAYDIGPVEENGVFVVNDTARIKATLPTIRYLIEQGCKIVLLTWVKRPGGQVVEALRTAPHAHVLERLIGRPVRPLNDCVGSHVDEAVRALKAGELLMLENTRFHPEEAKANQKFARALAQGKDMIVFDAFGHAHRVHASTTGILQELPAVAGMLMDKEFSAYEQILKSPQRPLVAILGGAKISDKLDTLRYLLTDKVDYLLIGGALANTFMKGMGKHVGASLVENKSIDQEQKSLDYPALARMLYQQSPTVDPSAGLPAQVSRKLVLPVDMVAASDISIESETKVINTDISDGMPPAWKYLDIGPRTVDMYKAIIARAKTIFWNGPMGYFELEKFGAGTRAVAEAVARSQAFSIVAGGDTETVIDKYQLHGQFDHVSTGGGVSLKILAGKELPVVRYLRKD